MKTKYINTESPLYKEAVKIRTELFFKDMKNSSELIQDSFEDSGIHLVCIKDDEVIGTGRLNIENETSIMSQMAIKLAYQKQGVGAKILNELVSYSKEQGVSKIKLSARETSLRFYRRFNFIPVGEKYPSKKTRIIHQEMELIINR